MDLGTLEPTPFSADDGPALHATLPPIAIVVDDDDDDDDVAEAEGVGPQISVHESTDGDETYEWSERGPKEAKADVGYGATEGFNDDEVGCGCRCKIVGHKLGNSSRGIVWAVGLGRHCRSLALG